MTYISGMQKTARVAIIADWLTNRGGAEHVIEALAEMFPQAVVFTSVYSPEVFPALKYREVRTSFLQKLPKCLRKKHQFLLPWLAKAFQKLDLSEFDVIISSSSAFSKCVQKTRPEQVHVCYCHSPTRYLYHAKDEYLTQYKLPWWAKPGKLILPKLLNYLKKIDRLAAHNVDYFISNSDYIGKRIEKYYGRPSETIYPGINCSTFTRSPLCPAKKSGHLPHKGGEKVGDYFLAVGRFIPYKKMDLLVKTFKENKLKLKLAGIGPELERCKQLASGADNIEFLGFVENNDLPDLYAEARAFLFPAEEDFGLTPIEAMASGCPVIYYAKGGACESVGDQGFGFESQTKDSLQKILKTFMKKERAIERKKLLAHAQDFDKSVFQKNIEEYIMKIT